MESFHGIVALLAFVLLVVTGMVAWLYMQQTRLLQAVNALAIAVATPPERFEEMIEHPHPLPPIDPPEVDDRVSVYEEEDKESIVEDSGVETIDEDTDFSKKTVLELRDLLTKKGIPFNKSDKKPMLVSLLRATS